MMKPGDELSDYRKKKGLSQSDFGALVGASQAQISRLEGNDVCPTVEQGLAIEREAGIGVERWPWTGALQTIIRRRGRRAS